MGFLRFGLFWFAIAAVCACSPSPIRESVTHDSPLDFYVERMQSSIKLGQSAHITIINHWGDIRLRSEEVAGAIVADAAVQRIGDPFPAKPAFSITESSNKFELVVNYPDASIEPRTGRVDLAVYVPDGFKVSLETLDGAIEAKKTAVDLTARTLSGEVSFINQGSAEVESRSGAVLARPMAPGWGALKLFSADGKITAFLPVGKGLEVIARGTDEIRSDWPLVPAGADRLLRLGAQDRDRDTVLITSGQAIELLEVVTRP